LETPYIFPVIDPTLKNQIVGLDEIRSIGFNGIITNAYLLKKNLKTVESIHERLNFDGIIMTDSGAYQILRYGHVETSNREIVQYQCDIGSDIGVILDMPTPYYVTRENALKSAEITLNRAIEVSDIINSCRETLWVLPIQGGTHLDVLSYYARRSTEIFGYGYSIYALGSPTTLLENYILDKVVDMVYTVRSSVEPSRPLHLFGAGHPLIIPFVVALGVDLMDSASYILYAKDKRYITRRATYRLDELQYLPCSCPICSKYTAEELREIPGNEVTKLLALHNLYTLYAELKEIKECIKEGRLWEYLEEKARAHPAGRRAFEAVKKYLAYIYSRAPYSKPRGKGVFIVSEDSVYNPKILIPRRKIIENMTPEKEHIVFIPLRRPYETSHYYTAEPVHTPSNERCIEITASSSYDIYLYHPVLGIVPKHLLDTYPFSQFETFTLYRPELVKTLVYTLIEFVLLASRARRSLKVHVIVNDDTEWQRMFAVHLKHHVKILRSKGIEFHLIENNAKRVTSELDDQHLI